MTPAARADAAIAVLDRILAGDAAERALLGWARASRHAGSGDRAAVRDLVYDSLRQRQSRAAQGGALSGRGLILGMCREEGLDPDSIFGAGGYAPAPLDAAERVAGRAPDADETTDLPAWLLPDLRRSLGGQFDSVAAAMRDRAPVWLRANSLRATPERALAGLAEDGITAASDPDLPTALRVTEGARRIARSRAYGEGLVELQDLSPQHAVAALGDLRGQGVLDFCAGGGGKALALAAAGAASVLAHDASAGRMTDLPARAARAGARITLSQPGRVAGQFDLVVVDAPCSGSGSWRRDPDGRWRLTPARLADLQRLQATILDEALCHLQPGGRLAYMTCSLLEAENGEQARALLTRHPALSLSLEDERRWLPPRGDGFYLAVFRRAGAD